MRTAPLNLITNKTKEIIDNFSQSIKNRVAFIRDNCYKRPRNRGAQLHTAVDCGPMIGSKYYDVWCPEINLNNLNVSSSTVRLTSKLSPKAYTSTVSIYTSMAKDNAEVFEPKYVRRAILTFFHILLGKLRSFFHYCRNLGVLFPDLTLLGLYLYNRTVSNMK